MKKSSTVSITLLAAAALLSTAGCESRKQLQRCVDANGKVVGDGLCEPQPSQNVFAGHGYPYYRWYYGGSGYTPGQQASDGSFEPAPDTPVVRASSPEGAAVLRGGFGHGFFGGGGA